MPYLCIRVLHGSIALLRNNIEMEIKIDPIKKKIVIKYDIEKESKKLRDQIQSLADSLPNYLLEILPSLKNKKDKGSQS